jgi:hypothetical protein
MADVASKQQTTALFLSTIVTRTRIHTELKKNLKNLYCATEHSVQSFMHFITQTAQFNLECMGPFLKSTHSVSADTFFVSQLHYAVISLKAL